VSKHVPLSISQPRVTGPIDDWVKTRNGLDQEVPADPAPAQPPPPPEPTKRLTMDLPASLHQRVKVGCAVEGVRMTDVVRELLEARFPAKP
jgi:hypothetical protein